MYFFSKLCSLWQLPLWFHYIKVKLMCKSQRKFVFMTNVLVPVSLAELRDGPVSNQKAPVSYPHKCPDATFSQT